MRNKFEVQTERQLKRSRVKFKYEAEKIPYILCRHYIPDFILDTKTGKVYIETKGLLRREDKAKLVAVKKQHPELDIRILFYASRPTYIKWANRHGFKWAITRIPQDWINGF